ncbi:MAG TPA: hypothetical protein PKW97_13340 [Syntrophorhabdus sp.]|nr:hypothetical protein [Syntrophorhabdus sp.]
MRCLLGFRHPVVRTPVYIKKEGGIPLQGGESYLPGEGGEDTTAIRKNG